MALSQIGAVGEAMFAGKLGDIVGSKIRKVMEDKIAVQKAEQWPAVFTAETFKDWRKAVLDVAEQVEGLELTSSKRTIDLKYRTKEIPKIAVTCLAHEVELRIWAELKSIAVGTTALTPLAAEHMMGFSSKEHEAKLKIDPGFLLKASCSLKAI